VWYEPKHARPVELLAEFSAAIVTTVSPAVALNAFAVLAVPAPENSQSIHPASVGVIAGADSDVPVAVNAEELILIGFTPACIEPLNAAMLAAIAPVPEWVTKGAVLICPIVLFGEVPLYHAYQRPISVDVPLAA